MLSSRDEGVPEDTTNGLTPLVRLVLWDYERGSVPYDIAFVLVLLALFLVPVLVSPVSPLWAQDTGEEPVEPVEPVEGDAEAAAEPEVVITEDQVERILNSPAAQSLTRSRPKRKKKAEVDPLT